MTFQEKALASCDWSAGDVEEMWSRVAGGLRKVAKDVLGETKGGRPHLKESWWWSKVVQEKLKEKRVSYLAWHNSKCSESRKKYVNARATAKKAVSEAKARVLDDVYKKLDTKGGEKEMYKLAKARERRIRDVIQVKCIKGEDGHVLVSDEQIVERWHLYFSQLYNDTGGSEVLLGGLVD